MIKNSIFDTSPHTLKMLAALVWYSGFLVLFLKSTRLFLQADKLNHDQRVIWLAILMGFLIGVIKAKYLYQKLCLRNLKRINSIKQPRIWHFYRIQFFIFLASMIVLGLWLSKWTQDNSVMLIILAMIELSIATALLGSCHCFWKKST